MPLTVNVGMSRKSSQNYQSAGVSINLTAELDQSLLADPPRLQQEIDRVYLQAHSALDRQAAALSDSRTPQPPRTHTVTVTAAGLAALPSSSGHRHAQHSVTPLIDGPRVPQTGSSSIETVNNNLNSNGSAGSALRPATESQLRALHSICRRLQCELTQECHDEFGSPIDQLDVRQASRLIDLLKHRQAESPAGLGRFRA